MRRIFRGLNRKSKPVRSGEPGRRVERRRDVVCLIEIRSLWLARLQPPALPSRRVPRDQVVLDGILEHRREPPARADCGSSPPLGGTAKIRPKCAIAALRTGKRTHDRRQLRMPFSEGNSVICCGECESRHCGSSPDSLQRTGLRLAPTAACSRIAWNQPRRAQRPVLRATAGAYRGWSTAHCRFRPCLGCTPE